MGRFSLSDHEQAQRTPRWVGRGLSIWMALSASVVLVGLALVTVLTRSPISSLGVAVLAGGILLALVTSLLAFFAGVLIFSVLRVRRRQQMDAPLGDVLGEVHRAEVARRQPRWWEVCLVLLLWAGAYLAVERIPGGFGPSTSRAVSSEVRDLLGVVVIAGGLAWLFVVGVPRGRRLRTAIGLTGIGAFFALWFSFVTLVGQGTPLAHFPGAQAVWYLFVGYGGVALLPLGVLLAVRGWALRPARVGDWQRSLERIAKSRGLVDAWEAGPLLIRLQRWDEAAEQAHRQLVYYRTTPRRLRALVVLGRSLLGRGRLDEVDPLVRLALDLDAQDADVLGFAAEVALRHGDRGTEVLELTRAALIAQSRVLRQMLASRRTAPLLALHAWALAASGHADEAREERVRATAALETDAAARTDVEAWLERTAACLGEASDPARPEETSGAPAPPPE